MAVEEERAAETIEELTEQCFNGFVVRAVSQAEALLELLGRNGPAPEITMLLCASRNDAKTTACTGADSPAPCPVNDRRIDIVFGTVAVDGGTRGSCDNGAAAPLQGTPHEAIDEGIFERRQRAFAARRHRQKPVWIVAAGMRDREEDRQVPSRFMNDGRGELVHGQG